MKPFPKMEDYDHEYADIIDVELPAYHRARADWYESEVVPAIQALGYMPEGYCFCSDNRVGDDRKEHEPECRDLRAVLRELEG